MNYASPRLVSSRTGLTITELLVIIAILFVIVLMILPATPWTDVRSRAACQSNLKEMGTIFRMYSDESVGNLYPTRASFSLSPDGELMYPDYINDFAIWVCPASREAEALLWPYSANPWYNDAGEVRMAAVLLLGDTAYTYFGFHASENAWADSPSPYILPIVNAARNSHFESLTVDHPDEAVTESISLHRLHPNVAKEMNDAGAFSGGDADLPVMWDGLASRTLPGPPYGDDLPVKIALSHFKTGTNVLFLDGHVEYREFANEFPDGESIARLELYSMVHWQAQGPGMQKKDE